MKWKEEDLFNHVTLFGRIPFSDVFLDEESPGSGKYLFCHWLESNENVEAMMCMDDDDDRAEAVVRYLLKKKVPIYNMYEVEAERERRCAELKKRQQEGPK